MPCLCCVDHSHHNACILDGTSTLTNVTAVLLKETTGTYLLLYFHRAQDVKMCRPTRSLEFRELLPHSVASIWEGCGSAGVCEGLAETAAPSLVCGLRRCSRITGGARSWVWPHRSLSIPVGTKASTRDSGRWWREVSELAGWATLENL
jgi:hypothetical protein